MNKYQKFLARSQAKRTRIVNMRAKRLTLQAIATKMGISRQRVSAILKQEGVSGVETK